MFRSSYLLTVASLACVMLASSAGADTYADWAARVFSAQEQADPTISGENANPAGDGVSNLLKFAFDLDPHQSGVSGLPAVGTVIDYNYITGQYEPFLAFTYQTPSTYTPENITYIPEVSSDLTNPYGWLSGPSITETFNFQSGQNPGDPNLYTIEALSPISQNPSLFMRLLVIDGHQLPVEWQLQYFGTTGIDPEADPDGDGFTNWQEFVNGTNPTDFYNGILPTLLLSGGGNQRGSPGTVLPTPVTVLVNSYGTYNAPLTFTVTSGSALLAGGNGAGYTPSASVQLRSISPFPNANGYMTYAAQAYVYLPSTGNDLSTITVTATSGTQTTSISTTEIASDPNVQPPSGFTAVGASATTASLSWTPSDLSLATNLEASFDGGITWYLFGSYAPGTTMATLSGLTHDEEVSLRVYTASAASSGTNSGAETDGGASPNDAGQADGSNATAPIKVTPLSVPVVEGERVSIYRIDSCFTGYQTTLTTCNRYLEQDWQINYTNKTSGAASQLVSSLYNVTAGVVQSTTTQSNFVDFTVDNNGYTTNSDTSLSAKGTGDSKHPDTDNGTSVFTLSRPYSISQFTSDVEGLVPAFQGNRTGGVDTAAIYFTGPEYFDGEGNLHIDGQPTYSISKVQYQFRCNADPNGVVVYDIVFSPQGGGAATHDIHVIQTGGATQVPATPITLDPTQLNNKTNGAYQIIPIAVQPADFSYLSPTGQGQTGVTGAMVPSIKGASGQKHFVSPKSANNFVTIVAEIPPIDNFNYAWSYPTLTPACQVLNNNAIQVPRDNPGQYTLQLKVKNADGSLGAVVDTINVWIVWATGTPSPVSSTVSTADSYPTTTRIGDSDNTVPAAAVAGKIAFDFSINPPTITDTTSDIPALNNGTGMAPVPGSNQSSPLTGDSLAGGADGTQNSKWDVSRKVSFTITNPSSVPLQYFSTDYGQLFKPNAVPSGNLVPFPTILALGNDDTNTADESNNPYSADSTNANPLLQHLVNHVTSNDGPVLLMPYVTPLIDGSVLPANAALSMELDFKEFVRLQIGNVWYEVSDPVAWSLLLTLQLQNNVWVDQGSTLTPAPSH